MRPDPKTESGFTLVEVLTASLVLVFGALGFMAVFPQAHRTVKDSGRMSVLNHLAAEKLEQLRSLDYGHADLGLGTHPTLEAHSAGGYCYPVEGFAEEYSLRWRVLSGPTDSTGAAEADMKTIVVEATYLTRYSSAGVAIVSPGSLEAVFRSCIAD